MWIPVDMLSSTPYLLFLTIAAMTELTRSMCWDLVVIRKDKLNDVAAAFYRKPISNECYYNRKKKEPPLCSDSDDPDAAWYLFCSCFC